MVQDRTQELVGANEQLQREMAESKRVQEALRSSEERFSTAFRVSPMPMAIQSCAGGHFLDANPSFLKLVGYQAEELLRRAKAGKLDPKAPAAISKPTIVLSCSAKEPDTDMPDECLDGWLGEVCRTRMVHFPRAYAWPALLAAASALVPPGSKRCNLYVDLDGPVHSGKSAAYEAAFHLLSLRKPVLMEVKAGSAEGLVKLAGDTAGAGRLLYPDELSHLLEKSKIERAAFPSFLTTAFYKDEQTLTVSKREVLEFNARLSVAGCTVDDQFADLFGAATTGGLHDRFLFGKCPDGYVHLWRDPAEQEPAFVPVAADDSFAPPERPVPVEIDKDVYRERDRWVKELGINPRVAEICLRAAVVTASFDGRRRLTADKLGPALALARYQERVRLILRPNPGENPDARMAFMIRSWLTANVKDSGWTGKRELNRRIHATERLGPGVFDRALNNLRFTGELEFNKIGRVEVLRLRPEDEVSPPKPGTNGDAL
jgi:hypothetical protein